MIPPSANKAEAAETFLQCINNVKNQCPNGIRLIMGDFNDCKVDHFLPMYEQFVKMNTCVEGVLSSLTKVGISSGSGIKLGGLYPLNSFNPFRTKALKY